MYHAYIRNEVNISRRLPLIRMFLAWSGKETRSNTHHLVWSLSRSLKNNLDAADALVIKKAEKTETCTTER